MMEAPTMQDLVFLGEGKLRAAGSTGSVQITIPQPWYQSQGQEIGGKVSYYQDRYGVLHIFPREARHDH